MSENPFPGPIHIEKRREFPEHFDPVDQRPLNAEEAKERIRALIEKWNGRHRHGRRH